MDKIALIIPYYGSYPDNLIPWLGTVSKNDSIDFYLFSDLDFSIFNIPCNVHVIKLTWTDLIALVEKKLSLKIKLKRPYKLCDFRPAYGVIFESYIKGYDWWGFCDIDLLFGDLRKYITSEITTKYDKIGKNGHLTLMRNNVFMNNLFKTRGIGIPNYKIVFKSNLNYFFDEFMGLRRICSKLGITEYIFTNVDIKEDIFEFNDYNSKGGCGIRYVKINNIGNFDRISVDSEGSENSIPYCHFQKRLINNRDYNFDENYYLFPNYYSNLLVKGMEEQRDYSIKAKEKRNEIDRDRRKNISYIYFVFCDRIYSLKRKGNEK